MKKTLLGTLAIMLFAGHTFAVGMAEQNTGCGLGTMLWAGNADDSMFSQALQATTNGTFGNQTFGISSGTLGCKQPSKFAFNDKLIHFASANLDGLARDIAMGQGESLETLAELMSVPAGQRELFARKLQANFDKIFPTGREDYATVLDSIHEISQS